MNVIKIKPGLCKNCYACIRACEVKATAIRNGQAEIISEDCIGCGLCIGVCPQSAREIRETFTSLSNLLRGKAPVWASLAPSAAVGPLSLAQWEANLKRLGFAGVSMTSWGAEAATAAYAAQAARDGFVLTTACPAAVGLVQRYYPDLARHLAEVGSPMVNHGAWLKSEHGARVVFIGPCAAKKQEAESVCHVDLAVTFGEMLLLFGETSQEEAPGAGYDSQGLVRFPVAGGLSSHSGVKVLAVDGLDELIPFLDRLRSGEVRPSGIIEMSACRGSCLGGPAAFGRSLSLAERRHVIEDLTECTSGGAPAVISRYLPQPGGRRRVAQTEIEAVLRQLGKADESLEYNCGACGYHTCREKAEAVVLGRAELEMCLPHMRAKAESLANLILGSTPNGVVVVDRRLQVQEWNEAAERITGVAAELARGKSLEEWLCPADFARLFAGEDMSAPVRIVMPGGRVVEAVYNTMKDGELAMAVYTDISDLEAKQEALSQVRQETLARAQEVINKQMRVAQEIAGLLGETTAESKMLLMKLMRVVDRHA